ncbi:diacylglycerol kinase [Deinococcus proteolyticus MRP]|uniref:Diacylglycerol kinase n=1 Tax=Deinococcus proteolyticus (strain ATCC 35074 / DSM 20540 / JCM 6276 / NBRC 101906 / NCIMB 13154 / VKM Ac-1939 / CCM 2703 / MRP) TaxID=693977 RepID=F0RLW2_DEIPM|nr:MULTISPECIES: diacylglycerol kinase [Deinococcus]ADY26972.1 diacylglycerol kinase [Deinococcus proteolyticus MRP]MCY1703100.1 diacylglycerol kinase [Deinococcus sp. SL84]
MSKNVGSPLSLRRWLKSAGYAWAGVQAVYRSEANFRIEVWAAVLALTLTLVLGAPLAPILLACALVLSLELLNSAVEAVVDLVSPQPHPLAKVAKDAAAGAVYMAALFAVLVGLSVLGPRLWALVSDG